MNTLKNKILFVCPKCKRVKLLQRSNYDIKDAVFVEIECDRCGDTGSKDVDTLYYDTKGLMNYRESIWEE